MDQRNPLHAYAPNATHAPGPTAQPPRARRPLRRGASAVALAGTALLVLAMSATATLDDGHHGTLAVHDELNVTISSGNVTVSCEFYIEGSDMAAQNGTLVVTSLLPTGDVPVLTEPFHAELEGTQGLHFVEGPFTVNATGHYKVEALIGATGADNGGNATTEHTAQVVLFVVDACINANVQVPCPQNLVAVPQADGSVRLNFSKSLTQTLGDTATDLGAGATLDAVVNTTGYQVLRAEADSDLAVLATLPGDATGFHDTTTVAGNAYVYVVVGLSGANGSAKCPNTEVTTIPEFPTSIGIGLAAALGSLGYVGLRRRQ